MDHRTPARGRGGYGGHAIVGYGLAKRTDAAGRVTWGVRTRNSWSAKWGDRGNCVMPESLFGGPVGGWWVVRSTVQTPTDWPPPDRSPRPPRPGDTTAEVSPAW